MEQKIINRIFQKDPFGFDFWTITEDVEYYGGFWGGQKTKGTFLQMYKISGFTNIGSYKVIINKKPELIISMSLNKEEEEFFKKIINNKIWTGEEDIGKIKDEWIKFEPVKSYEWNNGDKKIIF